MNKKLLGMSAGAGIVLAAVEFFKTPHDGSLLFAMMFWVAVAHGIVAITAAAHLAQGKWIEPMKDIHLNFYPYLAVFPIAFIGMWGSLHIYNWSHHTTAWLQPGFFVIRNVVMLAVMFLLAWYYTSLKEKQSDRSRLFAVLYIFTFVTTHTLIAMDWVMSFEFPWISTMFGPMFFVEALFGGVAVLAIFAAFKIKQGKKEWAGVMKDFATLMCGFGLFWGGLFFAQFLTIWYGNIPEEVAPIFRRIEDPVTMKLGIGYLVCLFLIPFLSFTGKKIKTSPTLVTIISLIVLLGINLERLVYLLPVTDVSWIFGGFYWILLGIPFLLAFREELKKE